MPRYYFHQFDGVEVPDKDGLELADLDAAEACACSGLRDIAAHQVLAGLLRLDQRIEIRSKSGGVLGEVRLADAIKMVAS
jgi:hypothetical protein